MFYLFLNLNKVNLKKKTEIQLEEHIAHPRLNNNSNPIFKTLQPHIPINHCHY